MNNVCNNLFAANCIISLAIYLQEAKRHSIVIMKKKNKIWINGLKFSFSPFKYILCLGMANKLWKSDAFLYRIKAKTYLGVLLWTNRLFDTQGERYRESLLLLFSVVDRIYWRIFEPTLKGFRL